jgi:HD-GYP domain-containing protein (c-di-GMP phosphodiesterase class II)
MTAQLIPEQAETTAAPARGAGVDRKKAFAAMSTMQRYAEISGLPMMCVDAATGVVLAKSDADLLPCLPAAVLRRLEDSKHIEVLATESGLLFYVVPLPDADRRTTVAVGYRLTTRQAPHELVLAAAQENWSQERLNNWVQRQEASTYPLLKRLLELTVASVEHDRRESVLQLEIEQTSDQIEQTYEEISLLHSLTRNLQISRSPVELAELCLNRLYGLIKSQGLVIWIEEKHGHTNFLVKGQIPFDELGMARLLARFDDHVWSRPMVKNHVEGTLLGADFPGLRSLLIVPIAEGTHRSGWILSCNLEDDRPFGTVEASLLNSVATILGTHMRNIYLYQQHHELMLSFVRSLVSTLDAKDCYTRGHSERVALIARRLGQELNLPEEDQHDIYLAGLLHDIGKIGVDDRILQKPGKLTDEEFKKIQAHPMIGYSILQGLKNLQKILPGVRNHHENYNGKGYPDGLKGEEIPLMARILAVADAYDAMGSDRPYRPGMPVEQIEEIFRRGAGDQWDARVINAYFAVREDINRICSDYSPQKSNLLCSTVE